MISNPNSAGDFDKEIQAIARRDVDVLIVGNTVKRPGSIGMLEDAGHSVYLDSARITLPLLEIQSVRPVSPARYEYYRKLIVSHPGAKLPRSKAIRKNSISRLVAINAPSAD